MRLLRAGLVQLLLVSALGLASASPALALELPDAHVLSGETYPVTGEGKIEGPEAAAIETELGEKLTANSVTVTGEFRELSSSGPGTLTYTGLSEPRSKTSCNTAGDVEGVVLISGEYHVVDTSESPLTVAALLLFNEVVVLCNSGKLKIKARGPVVIKLEKITSGVDFTEFGAVANCSGKGKQELKEYLNDEGKKVKGVMTLNFGLGFEPACKRFSKEVVVKMNKMVDVLF
jgi:hypothetical protein